MLSRRFFLGVAAVAAVGVSVGQGSIASGAEKAKDIVATAVEAGSFQTLAAALKAGGLVETLQGPGPFTVFAPTDDAFDELAGALADLESSHGIGK